MTYGYTIIQWLFFFYLYCFAGWCIESAYVSVKDRKLTNRGFMRGPFLPLYGSGAIMMLLVSAPFQRNLWLTYLAGVVGATVLEYVTGVAMEALFKVRYWDYSEQPFNFQGQVCLGTSLSWGLLTIVMTRFVHKPIEHLVLSVPENVLTVATIALTACLVSDFTMAFRAAMDLRDVLVKMQKARVELEHLQKRLDAYLAFGNVKSRLDAVASGGMEELAESVAGKFEMLKQRLDAEKVPAALQDAREEIAGLYRRFTQNLRRRVLSSQRERSYFRSIFRGNPTLTSAKFKEALEELKKGNMQGQEEDE